MLVRFNSKKYAQLEDLSCFTFLFATVSDSLIVDFGWFCMCLDMASVASRHWTSWGLKSWWPANQTLLVTRSRWLRWDANSCSDWRSCPTSLRHYIWKLYLPDGKGFRKTNFTNHLPWIQPFQNSRCQEFAPTTRSEHIYCFHPIPGNRPFLLLGKRLKDWKIEAAEATSRANNLTLPGQWWSYFVTPLTKTEKKTSQGNIHWRVDLDVSAIDCIGCSWTQQLQHQTHCRHRFSGDPTSILMKQATFLLGQGLNDHNLYKGQIETLSWTLSSNLGCLFSTADTTSPEALSAALDVCEQKRTHKSGPWPGWILTFTSLGRRSISIPLWSC